MQQLSPSPWSYCSHRFSKAGAAERPTIHLLVGWEADLSKTRSCLMFFSLGKARRTLFVTFLKRMGLWRRVGPDSEATPDLFRARILPPAQNYNRE